MRWKTYPEGKEEEVRFRRRSFGDLKIFWDFDPWQLCGPRPRYCGEVNAPWCNFRTVRTWVDPKTRTQIWSMRVTVLRKNFQNQKESPIQFQQAHPRSVAHPSLFRRELALQKLPVIKKHSRACGSGLKTFEGGLIYLQDFSRCSFVSIFRPFIRRVPKKVAKSL